MPRDAKLDDAELAAALTGLPEWTLEGGELVRTVRLATFPQAIAFTGRVAEAAEVADHHPDIDIRYNKLRFALVTHDSGGITQRDIHLAREIDVLYDRHEGATL